MFTCSCCNVETEKLKLITCFVCKKSYNHVCVGLSVADIRTITAKNAIGISWNCPTCRGASNDIILELKSMITGIMKELNDLKNQLVSSAPSQLNTYNFEDVIQEIDQRQSRKCNIIISGVVESSSSERVIRAEDEKRCVGQILNHLCPNLVTDAITPIRLGKYDPQRTKPRLIKVKLSDESTVHNIIKKSKSLKDNALFKHITIFFDKTPKQIKHYNAVKLELQKRTDNGERNLKLKYIRGVPTIVPLH